MLKSTRDVVNHTFGEALPATNSKFAGSFDPKTFEQLRGDYVACTRCSID